MILSHQSLYMNPGIVTHQSMEQCTALALPWRNLLTPRQRWSNTEPRSESIKDKKQSTSSKSANFARVKHLSSLTTLNRLIGFLSMHWLHFNKKWRAAYSTRIVHWSRFVFPRSSSPLACALRGGNRRWCTRTASQLKSSWGKPSTARLVTSNTICSSRRKRCARVWRLISLWGTFPSLD